MPPEPSSLPPIALLRDFIVWSNTPDLFWTHRAELGDLLHQYGRLVKQLVVWLELHGCDDSALRIDLAMAGLRTAWHEYTDSCDSEAPNAREALRCRVALDVLLEQADCLKGALEDIADELPESVWEGFGDV
ncbi:MAG: hypothetical protein H8E66_34735 [Planctomycetes bacterium]|nr:hypothetical protein [Planctomycetota bacterium]